MDREKRYSGRLFETKLHYWLEMLNPNIRFPETTLDRGSFRGCLAHLIRPASSEPLELPI